MSLLRIGFAIVIGILGFALMQWLTTAPHLIDVLVGLAAGFIAYVVYPNIHL